MLTRSGTIALRALVELAREPSRQLSGPQLAQRQGLPEPMLEQVLLQLREAGLVEAKRGRTGGYRLAIAAEKLPVLQVLEAVSGRRSPSSRALEPAAAASAAAAAGEQLEQQLQRRLERAVERELAQLNLAELLHDQRSWEASLDPEGGLMLG